MQVSISHDRQDETQRFFSEPLAVEQRATVQKLLIVEQILQRMRFLGLSEADLPEKMQISEETVAAMMEGTGEFGIETLIRVADALGCELQVSLGSATGKMDQVAAVTAHPSSRPYKELLGVIPAEESDEEFLKDLEAF